MVLSGWMKTLSKCTFPLVLNLLMLKKNILSIIYFAVFLLPQRVIIALMGFFAIAISYCTRTSLSFALTKMVVIHSGTVASTECIANGNTTAVSKDEEVCLF